MFTSLRYCVVLLPVRVPLAEHCSLEEAAAFLRGYLEVAGEQQLRVVIEQEREGLKPQIDSAPRAA